MLWLLEGLEICKAETKMEIKLKVGFSNESLFSIYKTDLVLKLGRG